MNVYYINDLMTNEDIQTPDGSKELTITARLDALTGLYYLTQIGFMGLTVENTTDMEEKGNARVAIVKLHQHIQNLNKNNVVNELVDNILKMLQAEFPPEEEAVVEEE